jgi:hypothetical protein
MNITYRDLMLSRVHATVGAAKAVQSIGHKGLEGQLREIVIRELFRPLFPNDIGVGTGEIITASNRHSKQQDVVIYDKRILPPFLLEQSVGIFPIESVLYTIEVKSVLNADRLRASHESAKELREFDYLPGEYDEQERPICDMEFARLNSTLLAFDTDLTESGKNEIDRYDEIRGADFPAIVAICVVGRGYWYWKDDQWKTFPCRYPFYEVVLFIAGVLNTYQKILERRGNPRLGHYLLG